MQNDNKHFREDTTGNHSIGSVASDGSITCGKFWNIPEIPNIAEYFCWNKVCDGNSACTPLIEFFSCFTLLIVFPTAPALPASLGVSHACTNPYSCDIIWKADFLCQKMENMAGVINKKVYFPVPISYFHVLVNRCESAKFFLWTLVNRQKKICAHLWIGRKKFVHTCESAEKNLWIGLRLWFTL